MCIRDRGLSAKIFMGSVDIERQAINCKFMRDAGAEIIPVTSGSATLVDAVSECQRYYVANCDTTHLAVGSAIGANVFLKILRRKCNAAVCHFENNNFPQSLPIVLKNYYLA